MLFPCRSGYARLPHFLLDAGECCFAVVFLSFFLRHASMMTWRPKPFCSILNRKELGWSSGKRRFYCLTALIMLERDAAYLML